MEKDFAILVLNACFRASRELGEIGVLAEEFLPVSEATILRHSSGYAVAEIGRITEHIYKSHPDLEIYVEERIEKFGRLS